MQYTKNKILTEATLIKLYIDEGLIIPQIALSLGVSYWAVKKYLHLYGVIKKKQSQKIIK